MASYGGDLSSSVTYGGAATYTPSTVELLQDIAVRAGMLPGGDQANQNNVDTQAMLLLEMGDVLTELAT